MHASQCDTLLGLNLRMPLYNQPSEEHYCVGHPDILEPASNSAFSAFAYTDGHSAGIAFKGVRHKALTIGVPFECIADEKRRELAMRAMLNFLTQ